MASISNDPNGRRRILFIGADGKRRSIRLGKVSLRYAESVKVKVEDLVSADITGHAPADETARWLAGLDSELYDKLARVGLAKTREVATLGAFTRSYIDGRVDIKNSTKISLGQARRYLLDCFSQDRQLRSVTTGDAEDFRMELIRRGLADNTVRRAVGRGRQFFRSAMRRGLIQTNPFDGIAASVRANPHRFYFLSRTDAQKVLNHCPDVEWKLIFALARFGGMRCPSEILALTWEDVNWEHNRIRVPSPKTAHHEGGASRMIPLFPELRPLLLEAFEQAEAGAQQVITRYRRDNANLRTQLKRIINRAGLEPWPKLFQNLRSTRETELAEDFPIHVVCKWIGNSQPVAAEHYLQLTDEHFERAVCAKPTTSAEAAHNAAQHIAEATRNGVNQEGQPAAQPTGISGDFELVHADSKSCHINQVAPVGLEPTRPLPASGF